MPASGRMPASGSAAVLGPMGAPIRRPTPQPSERRDRVRCEVDIEIDVSNAAGRARGVTRDLSEAGAFVATELEREIGSTLELHVHLPGAEHPSRCLAEVRWTRVASPHGLPPGLGLRFVQIEPEGRRAIQAFLLERAGLFLEEE